MRNRFYQRREACLFLRQNQVLLVNKIGGVDN